VAGLLAAALLVWQGSYAAFSATTQNTNDAWASGSLTLTNNGGTGTTPAGYLATTTALFNEANLKPGSTGTKCITVESGGSGGDLRLYRSALSDSTPSLGAQLQITVDAAPVGAGVHVLANCTAFPSTGVVNVLSATPPPAPTLVTMPTTYAAANGVTVPAGTQHTAYRITYTFASTGTTSGDNALQSKTATAAFTWEIQ
jgi:hypothetical protein